MVPLKRGGLRVGQWYLGINRRKAIIWPTRSVVAAVETGRRLVWDTKSSGAQWIWELEPVEGGTHVVHRRPVPSGVTLTSKLFAPAFLGGSTEHADELETGNGAHRRRARRLLPKPDEAPAPNLLSANRARDAVAPGLRTASVAT